MTPHISGLILTIKLIFNFHTKSLELSKCTKYCTAQQAMLHPCLTHNIALLSSHWDILAKDIILKL